MSSTFWMDRALSLARRGRGLTAPNPAVGAVLVKDGRLVGEGWHRGPGQPHAEAEALADARRRGRDPRGATLWVTLEPCCHEGGGKRTPPCTKALVEAGVAEVRAAVADPNPRVSGQGQAFLESAGIRFSWGPRAEEGGELIADFTTWIRSSRPFITLKWAQDLAGELRYPGPEGPWISGPESRVRAHRLRAEHDAVVVGAGTLRTDDPELTLRHGEPGPGGPPRRLVWAGSEPLPAGARLFTDDFRSQTWLIVRPGTPARLQAPGLVGSRFLEWDGQNWDRLGRDLLAAGFSRLLVEGGPTLVASLRAQGWWDLSAVFTAPRWVGGPGLALASPQWTSVGKDILLEGWNPEASCSPAW